MHSYCVIIPTHKEFDNLSEIELLCLDSVRRNFPMEKVWLVVPEGLDTKGYNINNVEYFQKEYFASFFGYNKMCTDPKFYERFAKHEYMLIHQLDAYTISNRIDYFMDLGYDWYGAPWENMHNVPNACGNGGYSLRKISKMIELCKTLGIQNHCWEDTFFCIWHRNMINACPLEIGWEFSFETYFPKDSNKIPMGMHKVYAYNKPIWDKLIQIR